jgi:hypothetical protein
MKTTGNKLDKIGKANPFKVPAGYFENFSSSFMSQLPEKEYKEPKIISLWQRVRPWMYAAAMIAGVMFMANIFIHKSESTGIFSEDVNKISITEIDEFNSYYQDKVAYASYQAALYDEIL